MDNKNYEIYNSYVINYDYIEENMTNLLLKNKKLLKDEIIEFSYNNEKFSNEVSNVITTFKENCLNAKIIDDDKVIIYDFIESIKSNKDLYKKLIDDFITLIKYLNDNKEKDVRISEINAKIKDIITKEFYQIFDDEKSKYLTVNKIIEIFECFLKLIFKDVKNEIKEFESEFKDKKAEKKKKLN